MRRVPEFLPHTIKGTAVMPNLGLRTGVYTRRDDGMLPPTHMLGPVQMTLVLFQSPALIQGLLMTEVKMVNDEIQRFFFGYRCIGCETIHLIHDRVRREEDVYEFTRHQCDPSEIRRAVRNARHLGLERGEHIMEGMNGKWYPEKHEGYFR